MLIQGAINAQDGPVWFCGTWSHSDAMSRCLFLQGLVCWEEADTPENDLRLPNIKKEATPEGTRGSLYAKDGTSRLQKMSCSAFLIHGWLITKVQSWLFGGGGWSQSMLEYAISQIPTGSVASEACHHLYKIYS